MMTCIKLIDNCMHVAINTNFRDQTNNVWPQILVTMGTWIGRFKQLAVFYN